MLRKTYLVGLVIRLVMLSNLETTWRMLTMLGEMRLAMMMSTEDRNCHDFGVMSTYQTAS